MKFGKNVTTGCKENHDSAAEENKTIVSRELLPDGPVLANRKRYPVAAKRKASLHGVDESGIISIAGSSGSKIVQ